MFASTSKTIRGLWYHNLLNGVCLKKNNQTGEFFEEMYKDSMLIDMTRGKFTTKFYLYITWSIVCIGAAAYLLTEPKINHFAIFALIGYWVACCNIESTWYIWNALEVRDAYNSVN